MEHSSLADRDGLAGCPEPRLRVHQVPVADCRAALAFRVPSRLQQDARSGNRANDGRCKFLVNERLTKRCSECVAHDVRVTCEGRSQAFLEALSRGQSAVRVAVIPRLRGLSR